MNMNQHIKDLIPTASDSIKVLKEFEDRYHFSRYDNLIYFITHDLEHINSYDEKIKVKFGYSKGEFERRWTSYCHHSTTMPFIIAVITIPDMKHYKLFYPETKFEDLPTVQNEETKLKKLYKDRVYFAKSKEKVKISLNEICDYFEKRQDEINKMCKEYNLDYSMWRIPFQDKDGNLKCRIEHHYQLERENAEREYKEKEKNKPLPLRKWGEKMRVKSA